MVSVIRNDKRVLAHGVDHRGLYFSVAVADPSDFYFGGKCVTRTTTMAG